MKYREEYFVYTTEWSPLFNVAGQAHALPIRFATEADFKAYLMTIAVKQADVLVVNWGGTIQIKDEQVGRDLYSNPIPVDAVAGTGRQPYVFAPPRVFNRGTTLIVTVTTNVVTATYVSVCIHGAYLYPVTERVIPEA